MQDVLPRVKITMSPFKSMIIKLVFNRFFLLISLLTLWVPVRAEDPLQKPGEIPQALSEAMRTGNTATLSGYFNTSIELAILDQEDIYTRQQAELIVKDFFTKHVPSSFVILHKGGKEGSQYAIGNLTTSAGSFRVTLLIKLKDNKPFIHQLRFEEGNAE